MPDLQYWIKRMRSGLYRSDQKAFQMEVNLLRRFQQAQREVNKEIKEIMQDAEGNWLKASEYLEVSNLTLDDIKKLYPECEVIQRGNKKYLFRDGRTLTRKKALQTRISNTIASLKEYEKKKLQGVLENTYEEEYYHAIFDYMQENKIAFDFTNLDAGAIRRAVFDKWCQGENFSDRVWKNKALLTKSLDKSVTQGIIKGEDFNKMTQDVAHEMQVGYHVAQRLVRTEVNHIYNAASNDSYSEGGIEEYQILAVLDKRTSKICREQDGKRYKVKDMVPGVNAPPFHPNCRTTTIPMVSYNRLVTRAARDESGKTVSVPGNLSYEDWKIAYVDNDNDARETLEQRVKEGLFNKPDIEPFVDSMKWLNDEDNRYLRADMMAWSSFDRTHTQVQEMLAEGIPIKEMPERVAKTVEALDKVYEKARSPKEVVVSRGEPVSSFENTFGVEISTPEQVIEAVNKAIAQEGIQIVDTYSSMTFNLDVANHRAQVTSKNGVRIRYDTLVPKDARVAYLNEHSVAGAEMELLADRKSSFLLLGCEYDEDEDIVVIRRKMLVD